MYFPTKRAIGATCILKLSSSLLSTPLSTCFQTTSLTPFFSLLSGSTSNSLLPTLNNYLGAVCPQPVCSNDTIKSFIDTIEDDCGDIISAFGLTNETVDAYVPFLPQVKNIVCLESNTNTTNSSGLSSEYCSIQTLSTFQEALGQPITFDLIKEIASGSTSLSSLLSSSNSTSNLTETLCTDCSKQIYNDLVQLEKDTASISGNSTSGLTAQVKSYLGELCGSAFTNGSEPTTVKNGTDTSSVTDSTSSTTTTSGAGSVLHLPVAGVLAAFGVVGLFI